MYKSSSVVGLGIEAPKIDRSIILLVKSSSNIHEKFNNSGMFQNLGWIKQSQPTRSNLIKNKTTTI